MDILRAELRLVHIAGSPLTGSLIGSVRRDGDIAFFCQPLGIKSGHLFFDASVGMSHHDGGIFFRGLISGGSVHVGRNFQAVQSIGDGMDIHFSFDVFHDGSFVDKTERIVFSRIRNTCKSKG